MKNNFYPVQCLLCCLLLALCVFINLSEKKRSVTAGNFGHSSDGGNTFSSLSAYLADKYADE